jgi:hypothetical protein
MSIHRVEMTRMLCLDIIFDTLAFCDGGAAAKFPNQLKYLSAFMGG